MEEESEGGVRRKRPSVHPPTDPAARAPAPVVGDLAPGVGAVPAHQGLVAGDAGDADSGHVQVFPGGADVGGVGRGAGARPVAGELQQVVEVDVPQLLKGMVLLGRDAGRVALSAAHHLGSEVSVHITAQHTHALAAKLEVHKSSECFLL